MACEKRLEDVESAVRGYHAAADRLQLIPATAKRAHGVGYEIEVNGKLPGSAPAEELVSVDLKGVIKPALAALREEYVRKQREGGEEVLREEEERDRSLERLAEQRDETAALAGAVKKLEAQYKENKERAEEQVRATAAQAEQLAQETGLRKQTAQGSLAAVEERLRTLQGEYDETCAQVYREKEQINNALLTAIDDLLVHKQHVQAVLRRVEERVNAVGHDVRHEVR